MRTCSTALLIGLVLPTPLPAQQADPIIVVTAPGGQVDIDEAVALDRDALAAGVRADLPGALQRKVPGLSTGEAQGNAWQYSIQRRGYAVSPLQGAEQGIAVYLDGIRFNQPFGDTVPMDLLPEEAIERAELLEANAVYGRNALGGALLLHTADGTERRGIGASAYADSIGSYGGSVSLGGGDEAKSGLAIAEGLKDRGWRDDSPSRLVRLFASGRLTGESAGVRLTAVGADTRLFGNGVSPVELLEADYAAVFTKPDISAGRYARFAAQPYVRISESARIEATLFYQLQHRRSVNGDLADFGSCEDDAAYLCLESEDDEFTDVLRGPDGARIAIAPDIDDYAVMNRARERSHGGGFTVQWLDERPTEHGTRRFAAGLTWERHRTRFTAASELGALGDTREVEALGPFVRSDSGGITPVDVVTRRRDFALFASAELPLSAGFSAELGLRWDHNSVALRDRIGIALNGDHHFGRLNPSVELDYKLSETVALSAGYSETSRSPTPAELSCADPDAPCALANFFVADPPLDQVIARSWHGQLTAGAESLRGTLAFWRSESSGDIRHIASDIRGRAYFANVGRSRKQGIEATLVWHRGPWRMAAAYGYSDARFRSPFTISSPSNPEADEEGNMAVEAGDRLSANPRHILTIQAGFESERWAVGADLRWRSSQILAGDEGNDNRPVPGYAVIDLRARLALTPAITLVGEVRNLFNHRYATFGTFSEIDEIHLAEAPGADDPRAYAPGAPRRAAVSVKLRF